MKHLSEWDSPACDYGASDRGGGPTFALRPHLWRLVGPRDQRKCPGRGGRISETLFKSDWIFDGIAKLPRVARRSARKRPMRLKVIDLDQPHAGRAIRSLNNRRVVGARRD